MGIADRNDNQVIWYEYNTEGNVTAVRDAHGRRVEYTYTNKLLTSVKDVEGNITNFAYNSSGKLNSITNAAGQVTKVNYDAYGRVQSVLDEAGKGYSFTWNYDSAKSEYYGSYTTTDGKVVESWFDKEGKLFRIDTNGRTTQKYVQDGRDIIWVDEKGNETRKYYDEFENLIKVKYPDSTIASNEYEYKFNKITKEISETGVVTTYQYDTSGNLIRKVEAAGSVDERITEYTYNADGYRIKEKILGNANTAASEINMTYNANGKMLTQTDAEGNTTNYTYDYMGNVLTKVDPMGKAWTNTYDNKGQLKTITDPLGKTTTFFYDGIGNKIKEVDPQGKERLYTYDQRKHLTKVTDSNGGETKFTYNVEGKLLQQIDADGKETNYQYDADGRLIKTIDGNGNTISNQYDDSVTGTGCSSCGSGTTTASLPSKTIFPTFAREYKYDLRGRKTLEKDNLSDTQSATTLYTYDAAGNLTTKTDKEGKVTTYEYDSLRRLKKVTDPLNQVTEYTYDNRDNLIALKDAKGQTTAFAYDKNNRLINETRPMGQETNYQYDATGRLTRKTDALGQRIDYGYDNNGRVNQIVQTGGETKTINFTYDDVGNLLSYSDGTTSATYTYDNLYRKTAETTNYGTFSLTTGYTYNSNGTKKTFTYPTIGTPANAGQTIEYSYDANNQIAGINIPNTGFISYGSYQWVKPTSITLPGGGTRQFSYDALMRTQAITGKDPGQNQIMGYNYAYDKMDNIKTRNTQDSSFAYNYDDLYRLTNVQSTEAGSPANAGYTYDQVGNRLTSTTATDWAYNNNNELISYNGVTPSPANVGYQYDANGNTTQKNASGQITNFVYNADNRLVEVKDSNNNTIAKYTYDPFGRRIKKQTGVGGQPIPSPPAGEGQGEGVVTTYYLYSDEGLIGEYDSTGTEIKTYGYKPNSTWTTDPLFMKQGTDYFFYHNDHLGTPQKMTNISGAVVWSATYDAFGKATVDSSSTVVNNLRFPGQYFDAETNLHYNYNRFYEPESGRYLREDPIGFAGGINQYAYVANNPVNNNDPTGEFPFHGNYCGPNYGNVSLRNYWDPKIDGGLDKCCYEHDKDYEENNIKTDCDMSKQDPDRKKYDDKLCGCLSRTKPPCKYWTTKWSLLKAFNCNGEPSSIFWWSF